MLYFLNNKTPFCSLNKQIAYNESRIVVFFPSLHVSLVSGLASLLTHVVGQSK